MKNVSKKIALVLALMMMFSVTTVFAKELPVPSPLGTTSDDVLFSSSMLGNSAEAMEVSGSAATPVDKAISKLSAVAEYWGWKTKRVGKTKILTNKVLVATVNLSNSKYEFKGVEVQVTSKRTIYVFGGYKYTLSSWKKTLKQYSTKADLKAVVVNKAKKAANSLKKYGSARNWQAKLSTKYKNSKAYATLNFTNSKYAFKVEIITARKSGKITTTYKASGVKTTLKWIKSCLETYKTGSKKSSKAYGGSAAGLITLTPDGDSVIESVPEESMFGSSSAPASTEDTTDEVTVEEEPVMELQELPSENSDIEELVELQP